MAASTLASLNCVACGHRVQVPPLTFRCAQCGDGLLIAGGPQTVSLTPAPFDGVWRFAPALPSVPQAHRISLGEGGTPLIEATIDGARIWIKNEGVSPTASYKDRFNAVNVSVASSLGYTGISLASTGNAGLSAAAYGARAGLDVRVYCPPESPPLILEAIRATGARVRVCSPQEARAHVAADVRNGFFPGSRAVPAEDATPFGCEGYKTISYEIVDWLGRAPTLVYVPVGGGDGIYGIHRGFADLRHSGLIEHLPRLVGVRTEASAALSIARDEVGEHARAAVAESGGGWRSVDDDQIAAAAAALAHLGVSAEPASAASLAGLLADDETASIGDAVCVMTGSGLKWPIAREAETRSPYNNASAAPPGR